jgi:hypothetical protein
MKWCWCASLEVLLFARLAGLPLLPGPALSLGAVFLPWSQGVRLCCVSRRLFALVNVAGFHQPHLPVTPTAGLAMRNFLTTVLSILALYVSSAPIRSMGRDQNRRTRETAGKKAKTLILLRNKYQTFV